VPRYLILVAILVVASSLRLVYLGRLSLWYDEVVPMRLARQPDPASLMRLLFQIEATRAPLHPLVLHYWLRLFGPSDVSGRALSALCGVLTVALVYRIGRQLYDVPTGLWGAWLCAISPLLVRYSQEAKMYAWLVLITCLSWELLISLRRSAPYWKQFCYALSLAALIYSHPLGIFMVAAHALAYLANRSAFQISVRQWLAAQLVVALLAAPWVSHYLDHPPEITIGRLPLKYLLGTPIGFTGGDSRTLLACVALIAWGLVTLRRGSGRDQSAVSGERWEILKGRVLVERPVSALILVIWFAVAPVLLYAYSWVSHPLFGPARYTLFVGPAYLLLLARGIASLPRPIRYPIALASAALAGLMLHASTYAPDLKADWRSASAYIRANYPQATVVVLSGNPGGNVEVETARYYLGPRVNVLPLSEALLHPPGDPRSQSSFLVVFAVGVREGRLVAAMPPALERFYILGGSQEFPGLQLKFGTRRLDVKMP